MASVICYIYFCLKVLVETELFPRGAIEYYTAKNMGWDITEEDTAKWWMLERGGDQGDYRAGMQKKIANAIDCLRTHPHSKRAIIPIPFNSEGSENVNWQDAGQVLFILCFSSSLFSYIWGLHLLHTN